MLKANVVQSCLLASAFCPLPSLTVIKFFLLFKKQIIENSIYQTQPPNFAAFIG